MIVSTRLFNLYFAKRILFIITLCFICLISICYNLNLPKEFQSSSSSSKSLSVKFEIKSSKPINLELQSYFYETNEDHFYGDKSVISNIQISSEYKNVEISLPIANRVSHIRLDLGAMPGCYEIKNLIIGNSYKIEFTKSNLTFSNYIDFEQYNSYEGKFVSTGVDPYFFFSIPENVDLKYDNYVDSLLLSNIYYFSSIVQNNIDFIILFSVTVICFILSILYFKNIYSNIICLNVCIIFLYYLTIQKNEIYSILWLDSFSSIYKITYNHVFILAVCTFLIGLASYVKRFFVSYIMTFILFLIVLVLICDSFSLVQFSTHIQLGDIFKYGKDTLKSTDIVISFISQNITHIILYVISIVTVVFVFYCRSTLKELTAVFIILLSFSVVGIFIPAPKSTLWESLFSNVFSNGNTAYNASLSYSSNYKFNNFEPEIKIVDGLNKKKNVIILMVESLSSSESKLLENEKDNLKYLDKISLENTYFTNYFSNGFNTDAGNFSFLNKKPFFQNINLNDNHQYDNSFIKSFNNCGYKTKVIYSASEIGFLNNIWKKSGFQEFYDGSDQYYESSERLAFGSVPDDIMFNNVLDKLNNWLNEDAPFLAMVMTTTTHSPFTVPVTHEHSFEKTTEYVDNAIYSFYIKLKEIGFFKNGILVITGDHRAMIPYSYNEKKKFGNIGKAKVPFVLVGLDIPLGRIDTAFSHSSAGTLIEYINLPKISLFDYQVIPIIENDKIEKPVYYQNRDPADELYVYFKGSEYTVNLHGDETSFLKNVESSLSDDVLKHIYWFKK